LTPPEEALEDSRVIDPRDLLVGIYTRAEAKGLPVTTWIEQHLFSALQTPPNPSRSS